ncbi:MAG: hypothetical protein QOC92_4063 [Acidimicrobiaceae bacterium]|jgi:hypothetical protein
MTRTRLFRAARSVDVLSMTATTRENQLSEVQDEIEALLAGRPVDDFSPPVGYRSLLSLESALLERSPLLRTLTP